MHVTLRRGITSLLALSLVHAQAPVPGVDPAVVRRIKQEVAAPLTSALPGWTVGDDLGALAVEAWDSEDKRHLRATLLYAPVARSARTTIGRLVGSIPAMPGASFLKDDPLCRSALGDDFAEAVTLVKTSEGEYLFYQQRAVALGDAFMPPVLLATFHSAKGQGLEEFEASVASRIRGLDPAFDTFLMLALGRRVTWDGDKKVKVDYAGKVWTFVAPAGFERVADGASIARWKSGKATARVRACLGSEKDAAAFAKRWLAEPCVEGNLDNKPLVLDFDKEGRDHGEQLYLQMPQVGSNGYHHRAQFRGSPPLYFVYDVAVEIDAKSVEQDLKKATSTDDAAVKAAFAATEETAAQPVPRPAKKG